MECVATAALWLTPVSYSARQSMTLLINPPGAPFGKGGRAQRWGIFEP
jgi:hypothetical protein